MYICLCNGYREAEIASAAQCGASTPEEAFHRLGNGPCCRRCLPTAQAIIDREIEMCEGLKISGLAQVAELV